MPPRGRKPKNKKETIELPGKDVQVIDSTEKSKGSSSNNTSNAENTDAKEYSCKHCKAYFPLLKSFIMHLESSHAETSEKDGIERYTCEVCHSEFNCSVVLGKHALEHVSDAAESASFKIVKIKNTSSEDPSAPAQEAQGTANDVAVKAPAKKRGRPRKNAKGSKPEGASSSTCQLSASEPANGDQEGKQTGKKSERMATRESFTVIRPRKEQTPTLLNQSTADSNVTEGEEKDKQNERENMVDDDEKHENGEAEQRLAEKKRRNVENQCIICLQKFATKEDLKQHRLSHGDKEKWSCNVNNCKRIFSSHWKYHDHCVKAHNIKKPFQCDICGKRLSSFTILATHKGLHSGSRPYVCDLCGKSYLVAAGLKDHMVTHKNERNHRCEECGAGFNAKGDLKKHMISHMPEKPHNCSVCNSGFNRAASLRRHMRTHTGEKPFQCDICEKAFSRKEKMTEHRRTHTGERPLRCPHCNKCFKDSSNFSNHKKIHAAGYVPRKRKRVNLMKDDGSKSTEEAPLPSTVSAEAVGAASSTAPDSIPVNRPTEMRENHEQNALKDFATISMATEGLQVSGQELFRQILGAAFDSNELRNLAAAQNVASASGGLYNLSPIDLRSLQMIINGAQARNSANSSANGTQVVASLTQNATGINQ